jgi:hypothetical protein
MAVDLQSNIYVAGQAITNGTNAPQSLNYVTNKYSPAGALVWTAVFNGPQNGGDIPAGIALYQTASPLTNNYPVIYVTGTGDITTTSAGSISTVKYTQQTITQAKAMNTDQPDLLNTDGLTASLASSLQNYPNPFRETTQINYTLPTDSHVTLQIYDESGKTIATPVNEYQQAGTHTVPFRSGRLAAGVYVYRIVASSSNGNIQATKEMVVE